MNARRRVGSAIPWAVGVAVGVGMGLGLTAYFLDEHANRTCGLIPSTVGLIVLIPAGLGVAALISTVVACRPAADTRRAGLWLLLVVVLAAVVFLAVVPAAAQQISPGCHRGV